MKSRRQDDTTRTRTAMPPARATAPFAFPADHHLLITTERRIVAWDADGVRTLLERDQAGLIAVDQTTGASCNIAIASLHGLVLHDAAGKRTERLDVQCGDRAQRLSFSPDARTLYYTRTPDAQIRQVSLASLKGSALTPKHDGAPAAFAVSCSGHLLVSASTSPPRVYVHDLVHNSTLVAIRTRCSSAGVSQVAFHPERASVFLLAFQDGTVATYDASKITKSSTGCEIAHVKSVHRAAAGSPSIVGAAFLPGYKLRAVTAGGDQRCKVLDFAEAGAVLQDWHVKAPISSLDVVRHGAQAKEKDGGQSQLTVARSSRATRESTRPEILVAVARIDGSIHLYNTDGQLVAQEMIASHEEPIINASWYKGSCPAADSLRDISAVLDDEPSPIPSVAGVSLEDGSTVASREDHAQADQHDLSTVRIASPSQPIRDGSTLRPAFCANFHDLFSPVKSNKVAQPPSPPRQSPPRRRTRLSSNTFAKSATPEENATCSLQLTQAREASPPPLPNSTLLIPDKVQSQLFLRPTVEGAQALSSSRASVSRIRTPLHVKPKTWTASVRKSARKVNKNARLLADLRSLAAATSGGKRNAGTLATYAGPSSASSLRADRARRRSLRASLVDESGVSKTDSDTSSSTPGDPAMPHSPKRIFAKEDAYAEDDIWLTDTEQKPRGQPLRARRRRVQGRDIDGDGQTQDTSEFSFVTGDVTTTLTLDQPSPVPPSSAFQHTDAPTLVPSSANEKTHLQRTPVPMSQPQSALSSRPAISTAHRSRDMTLTALALNVANAGLPQSDAHTQKSTVKSPWERMRAARANDRSKTESEPAEPNSTSQLLLSTDGIQLASVPSARVAHQECTECPAAHARVRELECEVATLRAEVLALRAVVRRNGLAGGAGVALSKGHSGNIGVMRTRR